MSAQAALRLYQRRWSVEVDKLYLKEALGLGDFHLQSFEATDKWFALVLLSLNYLQFQQTQCYAKSGQLLPLADLTRQHRLFHLQQLIHHIVVEAHRTGEIEAVVQRFIPSATWAVT